MSEQSLQPIIEKLESLFSSFNDKFYDGGLQKPIITVSPDATKGAYGWCTSWKAWKLEGSGDDAGYYEINICAEYLSRPFELVAQTLLHEMVHLYNLQIGVQDTSRSGTYHNKKFKEAAEQHGMVLGESGKSGYTDAKLNDEAKAFVESLTDQKFQLFREPAHKMASQSKSSSSRKYVCPNCGCIIRATKEVFVICGDCDVEFEEEE